MADTLRVKHPVKVHIRDRETKEIVHSIVVRAANLFPANVRNFQGGLFRKVDFERFYVDSSELDAAMAIKSKLAKAAS